MSCCSRDLLGRHLLTWVGQHLERLRERFPLRSKTHRVISRRDAIASVGTKNVGPATRATGSVRMSQTTRFKPSFAGIGGCGTPLGSGG